MYYSYGQNNILIITDKTFWHKKIGSDQRIDSLTHFLNQEFRNICIIYAKKPSSYDIKVFQKAFPQTPFHYPQAPEPIGIFSRMVKSFYNLKYQKKYLFYMLLYYLSLKNKHANYIQHKKLPELNNFKDRNLKRYVEEITLKERPRIIIIQMIRLAFLVEDISRWIDKRPVLIYDSHDILHKRYLSFCRQNKGHEHWIKISEDEEINALTPFDCILAIQGEDARYFRKKFKDKTILTVPHAMESGIKHDIKPAPPVRIGFVSGNDPSNIEALHDFLSETWPCILEKVKQPIEFWVAGSICDVLHNIPLQLKNIVLFGTFESVDDIYGHIDIAINPVKMGGGLKIKNVEALAWPLPLVTTNEGAVGLSSGIGKAFLTANSSQEFIDHLVRLIESEELRKQLRDAAFDFACQRFSQDMAYRDIKAYIFNILD